MAPYRCYYCSNGYGKFQEAISHTTEFHKTDLLKISTLELDIQDGKFGYRTHNFNLVPNNVEKKGQVIEVQNDEPGYLTVCLKNKQEESVDVINSPLSKILRLESCRTKYD